MIWFWECCGDALGQGRYCLLLNLRFLLLFNLGHSHASLSRWSEIIIRGLLSAFFWLLHMENPTRSATNALRRIPVFLARANGISPHALSDIDAILCWQISRTRVNTMPHLRGTGWKMLALRYPDTGFFSWAEIAICRLLIARFFFLHEIKQITATWMTRDRVPLFLACSNGVAKKGVRDFSAIMDCEFSWWRLNPIMHLPAPFAAASLAVSLPWRAWRVCLLLLAA